MNKFWGISIFYILLAYSSEALSAQDFDFGLTFGIGGNTYVGDLNPDRKTFQLNYQAGFHRYVDEHSFFKVTINYGAIQGEYEPGDNLDLEQLPTVNTFFFSYILSADASYNWQLIQWSFLHFYVGTGLGVMDYRIEDSQGRNLAERHATRLENEDYKTRIGYFTLSTGYIFFPTRSFNLIYERSRNLTNTDYLDNIGLLGDRSSDWILRRMVTVRYRF